MTSSYSTAFWFLLYDTTEFPDKIRNLVTTSTGLSTKDEISDSAEFVYSVFLHSGFLIFVLNQLLNHKNT